VITATEQVEALTFIEIVLTAHSGLCAEGYSCRDAAYHAKERDYLRHPDGVDQVATALAFLRLCERTKTPRQGSYGLKHVAERWGEATDRAPYVSNGALIVAALALDLVVEPHGYGSPNAIVGVARRSVDRLRAMAEAWRVRDRMTRDAPFRDPT
jgi:hypothetical protein